LKEDFGTEGFCMDSFCATETAMRFVDYSGKSDPPIPVIV
jgi:hypothetical protein